MNDLSGRFALLWVALLVISSIALPQAGGGRGTPTTESLIQGADRPLDPEGRDLLARLNGYPYHLPPDLDEEVTLALVIVTNGPRGTEVDGRASLIGGTLRIERAKARRRTGAPPHWVLQTDADGNYRYWMPIDLTRRVRSNLPTGDSEQPHSPAMVEVPDTFVALRLPFYPLGRVSFCSADGRVIRHFRWGKGIDMFPDDPEVFREMLGGRWP